MVRTRTVPPREKVPAPPPVPAALPEAFGLRLIGWITVVWLGWLVTKSATDRLIGHNLQRVFRDSLGGPYDWSDAARTWVGHARGILVAALWCLAAAGWGRPLAAWLGTRGTGRTIVVGLGFVALGLATWAAGVLGLLAPVCLAVLALPALVPFRPSGPRRPRVVAAREPVAAVCAVLTGVFLFIYAWPAFAPELGWDALTYHLQVPAHWLSARRIHIIPFSLGSFYPFLAEMWFMLGRAFGGDDAAKLVNYAFLPLTAASLVGIGTSLGSRTAGWLAALVYVAQPPAGLLSSQCYNDLEIAWLTLLAVDAALRPGMGWRIVSAVLCGGVLGCKYTGMLTLALCGSAWTWRAWREHRIMGGLILPSAVAGLVFAPWPIRDWLQTGNPVYPMAARVFPDSGWNPFYSAEQAARIVPGAVAPPISETLLQLVRLPYDFSVSFGAIGVLFTPLIFGLLPGLAVASSRRIAATRAFAGSPAAARAAAGLGFIGLWVVARGGDDRYLIPAVALLAVPAAEGALRLSRGQALRAALVAAAVVAALFVQAVHLTGYLSAIYVPWRVAAGAEPRRTYLCRAMLPNYETYPFAEKVNAMLPRGARVLLFSDIVAYYYDPLVVFDTQQVMPPIGSRLASACRDPRALRRRFRQLGIGWVIYSSRTIAFEKDCRCMGMTGAPRGCYRTFWRRYAELALEFASLRLFRLRTEREASRLPPAPFIALPGVQDVTLTVAEEARQANKPLDAAVALRRLVREEPELADARFKLAEVLLLAGRTDEARREVEAARRLGLDSGPWWVLEGGIRSSRKDHAGAYEATKEGVARWRGPRSLALLAAMAWNAGKIPEARAAIAEAAKLNPWDVEVRRIQQQMGK